jgi:type IV pilus assembly protein PilB
MVAANLISIPAAKRYEAVPVAFVDDRTLIVAMADPANVLAVDDIALLTGKEIRPAVTSREDILGLISRLTRLDQVIADDGFGDDAEQAPAEVVDLRESADDAPIIRLVNQIIAQAVERRASDVHLEPNGVELRVRFRIDGVLVESMTVQRRMVLGVISRVKIMSDLDISERRVPQDGRVGMTIDGHKIDLRVVTLPSVHGESVVMRILDKSSVVMELDKLGMGEQERERFERAFHQAYGAVLVTGPTGSGKSTTLYAALNQLNTIEKNIITIEDPVEYQLDGITQVQVNTKAGLHFHTGLRSMMRADPDIIMVGEIRDRETAQIAIESARPATSCFQRCTPTTLPARSRGSSRWASSRFSSPPRSTASSPSAWRASSASTARSARSSQRRSCAATASAASSTCRPTVRAVARAAVSPATRGASASTR